MSFFKILFYHMFRYSKISESKSFHDAIDGDPAIFDGSFDSCDDNEIISDNITLETEAERRQRLDSFYSATSAKSTYFSTGSISSYHSIDDPNNEDIGKLLIHTLIIFISRQNVFLIVCCYSHIIFLLYLL